MASLMRAGANTSNASPKRASWLRSKLRTRPQEPDCAAPADRSINSLIEGEIIPQLLFAHIDPDRPAARPAGGTIDPADVSEFAELPLRLEADELLREAEAFLLRGNRLETVFVEVLAPSARRLGELWENDECDFVDVTMGLWRLQEVMRELAVRSPPITDQLFGPFSALFSPMPGEQHSFGTLMIDEVFSRSGWQTFVLLEPRRAELLRQVSEQAFDLVGLTISCDCPSGELADLITAIRNVSKTASLRVMIGGRAVNADPALVDVVGADGSAPNAESALVLANELVCVARSLEARVP